MSTAEPPSVSAPPTPGASTGMRSLPTPPPSIPSTSVLSSVAKEEVMTAPAGGTAAALGSYPATPSSSDSTAPVTLSPTHDPPIPTTEAVSNSMNATTSSPPTRKRLKLDIEAAKQNTR